MLEASHVGGAPAERRDQRPTKLCAEALKKLLPLKRFIVVPVRAFGHGVLFGRLFVFIYVTS